MLLPWSVQLVAHGSVTVGNITDPGGLVVVRAGTDMSTGLVGNNPGDVQTGTVDISSPQYTGVGEFN